MDLSSRLRAIVKSGPPKPLRELTYEPDTGGYEGTIDLSRVGAILGGCAVGTRSASAWSLTAATRRIGSTATCGSATATWTTRRRWRSWTRPRGVYRAFLGSDPGRWITHWGQTPDGQLHTGRRTIFIDLETTGLSGGAGTVAFLVGCGYFDLGAFQVRQFLLTSYASERALLYAVAQFFEGCDLIVTYNGKTFDVPVMETRWLFHRLQMPLATVPHFDMLHPARRLWRARAGGADPEAGGCRLANLERTLLKMTRVGDVGGFEIPGRFFQFLRSGDPRPLEPVLEHNRLDLVSLAAVMSKGLQLARDGDSACRDCGEALALGRVYERAAYDERLPNRGAMATRAEGCYRRAAESSAADVRGEALYRLALRHRRERRFAEAAVIWREVIELTEPRAVRRIAGLAQLRRFAVEALAIHREHRERDLTSARELALFALEESDGRRADGIRHRLARLNEKLAQKTNAQLFTS